MNGAKKQRIGCFPNLYCLQVVVVFLNPHSEGLQEGGAQEATGARAPEQEQPAQAPADPGAAAPPAGAAVEPQKAPCNETATASRINPNRQAIYL